MLRRVGAKVIDKADSTVPRWKHGGAMYKGERLGGEERTYVAKDTAGIVPVKIYYVTF